MMIKCRLYNLTSEWRRKKKITRWLESRCLQRRLTQPWTPSAPLFPPETSDNDGVSLLCGCYELHDDNRFKCDRLYFSFEELLSYVLVGFFLFCHVCFISYMFVSPQIHYTLHQKPEACTISSPLGSALFSTLLACKIYISTSSESTVYNTPSPSFYNTSSPDYVHPTETSGGSPNGPA